MKKILLPFFIQILLLNTLLFCQNWHPVVPDPQLQSVYTFYHDSIENDLYIGGRFRYINGLDAKGIVKWDGQTFSTLGDFPNECNNYNCYEVYSIMRYKGQIYCTFINGAWLPGEIRGLARWNGVQWDSIGGLEGIVYDQVIYNEELYIMGRFEMLEDVTVNTIVKWDGENWHGVQFPYPTLVGPSTINCGVVYNGDLYVGGNFWNDDESIVGIARYDGANWYPVAGGIKGSLDNIFDMEVYNGELYVGGSFRKSAGNTGNKIMKLVGDEWAEVGGGFDSSHGFATKMLVYHNKLYVFGIFYTVGGGIPAQNIAVWDGERWCGLGSTFDESSIVGAVVYEEDLFICGNFDTIDGVNVEVLARWTAGDYLDVCGEPVSGATDIGPQHSFSLSPNPAHSQIQISAALPADYRGPAVLSAHNLLGQLVWSQSREPGYAEIQKTVDVGGWPPGVYVFSLEAGGRVWNERVVISEL